MIKYYKRYDIIYRLDTNNGYIYSYYKVEHRWSQLGSYVKKELIDSNRFWPKDEITEGEAFIEIL